MTFSQLEHLQLRKPEEAAHLLYECPCCRSQFSEEFRDSEGFGWTNGVEHKFEWEKLVAKKVSKNCAGLIDKPRTPPLKTAAWQLQPAFLCLQQASHSQQQKRASHGVPDCLEAALCIHCMPGLQSVASPFWPSSAMPSCHLQTKEVTRLNHVYLKLLRDAGVEVIGEPVPCKKHLQTSKPSRRGLQSCSLTSSPNKFKNSQRLSTSECIISLSWIALLPCLRVWRLPALHSGVTLLCCRGQGQAGGCAHCGGAAGCRWHPPAHSQARPLGTRRAACQGTHPGQCEPVRDCS